MIEEEVVRRARLEALRQQQIEPYPTSSKRTHTAAAINALFGDLLVSKEIVSVVGRILTIRKHGGMTFVVLEDGFGKLQLALKRDDMGEQAYQHFHDHFDRGDFLQAQGVAYLTKTEEPTVLASSVRMLSKSLLPLPEKWHGLTDVEVRYRKRYLDLASDVGVRDLFVKRSLVVKTLRRVLEVEGFMEVETPVLQPIASGAFARPFITHHNALDTDLYLRIAPELYLKRLVVGGFEKVFEFARCFRNEGISFQHNPEFTMLEFYWAYATYEDLMDLTERMITAVVSSVTGGKHAIERDGVLLDFSAPLPRVKFFDIVLSKTGIDLEKACDEQKLRAVMKKEKLTIDDAGLVGYGDLVDALYKKYVRPGIIQPTFLIDYPAAMIPLAKRKEGEPDRIATVQLIVQGAEVTKAYNELNDPLEQEARFLEEEGKKGQGSEEAMAMDTDFIEALKHGMPPTAGFGMGIDRLCAILTGSHSLKEVILFPTLRPEIPEAG